VGRGCAGTVHFKTKRDNQLINKNHSGHPILGINVIFITLAMVFVLLSFSVNCSLATPQFHFERILSLSAGPVGQTHPVSVTWDPVQGEVCVTDVRQVSLHVMNSFGIELFHTSQVARLSHPSDGSVDRQGRLVCLDRAEKSYFSIRRLNVYGEPDTFTAEIPDENWSPRHLLVTRDGHYLTLDSASGLMAKHDHETGLLIWKRSIAQPMGDDLHLGRPAEAADGRLYVPGGNLRQILVLNGEGKALEAFGEFGSAEGYFSFPVAVSFTPEGSLLVLDRMRHKIMVFDQEHTFVSEFGSMGSSPGQFYHPVAMTTDSDNQVYVAQGFLGRVQVFSYTDPRSEQ
jgi:outer membrane protein assembly factor BamB